MITRRNARRAVAILALAATALLLDGCVVLRVNPTALQAATIGDVTVHVELCASNVGACPSVGAADADGSSNQYDLQMLLGFLVPDGVDGPASFDTSSGPAGSFAPNASYASELELKSPAPAGSHWVGYASTSTYHWKGTANPATAFTADPAFRLRPAVDGSPFHGPFDYRAVVGIRAIDATVPLSSAVDCAGTASVTQTLCSEFPLGKPAYGEDQSLVTRDLGVVAAPSAASVTPGGTVSLPFTLRYAGPATAAANFALSAASTVPGASPTPSQASLAPASDSDSSVLATVTVPAGTAPGNYTVTLSAALPNGQKRSGTGALRVLPAGGANPPPNGNLPPDTTPPTATVAIRAGKLGALLKTRRLRVRGTLDEPGTVVLTAKLTGGGAHATLVFAQAGAETSVLTLPKPTAKKLRHSTKLRVTVTAAARDIAGNTSSASASRTFRR